MEKGETVGVFIGLEGRLVDQAADGEVGHQQAVELLADKVRRLAAQDDPGTPCPYFSAYWRQTGAGRRFISNRAHGALGYALPAAIGAAFAEPGAAVLSVMGDGSFAMAQGELETALRLQVPVTFVVVANSSFGWIKAGQKSGFGGRYFSVDFSPCPAAAIARAMGLEATRVEDPRELEPALRAGLRSGRPNLIEVVAQPLEEAAAPVSEWVA